MVRFNVVKSDTEYQTDRQKPKGMNTKCFRVFETAEY